MRYLPIYLILFSLFLFLLISVEDYFRSNYPFLIVENEVHQFERITSFILPFLILISGYLIWRFTKRSSQIILPGIIFLTGIFFNFNERIQSGYVLDYSSIPVFGNLWLVFNLADIYIGIGLILISVSVIKHRK